jgi:AraC family transcriptional regulator, arabinose operon regulatory protein
MILKAWFRDRKWAIRSDYFTLNGYGVQEPMPPGTVDRPRGTGDFLAMFFFDPVVVKVKGESVPVGAGTLMVWQPGSHQYYGNPSHGYLHSWTHCDGVLVHDLAASCGIPFDTPIRGLDGRAFERHLEMVHEECSHSGEPDLRIVENHYRNLFYEVQRAIAGGPQARFVPAGLLKARQHIESHYAQAITLAELARLANVSPPHFCGRFRKTFGSSPIRYLLDFRLTQAAYLLLDRNLRVGDVARRVGIEDVYYFSRVFKRRYGRSPRQMRDAHGG